MLSVILRIHFQNLSSPAVLDSWYICQKAKWEQIPKRLRLWWRESKQIGQICVRQRTNWANVAIESKIGDAPKSGLRETIGGNFFRAEDRTTAASSWVLVEYRALDRCRKIYYRTPQNLSILVGEDAPRSLNIQRNSLNFLRTAIAPVSECQKNLQKVFFCKGTFFAHMKNFEKFFSKVLHIWSILDPIFMSKVWLDPPRTCHRFRAPRIKSKKWVISKKFFF